jgi:hypothetical protein
MNESSGQDRGDVDALARALHRSHHAALDVLHGPGVDDPTSYDLETPERRAYLREQASVLLSTMPDPGSPEFRLGWMQGVADAGARLIEVVASRLGQDDPVVEAMVERLGDLVGEHGSSE